MKEEQLIEVKQAMFTKIASSDGSKTFVKKRNGKGFTKYRTKKPQNYEITIMTPRRKMEKIAVIGAFKFIHIISSIIETTPKGLCIKSINGFCPSIKTLDGERQYPIC